MTEDAKDNSQGDVIVENGVSRRHPPRKIEESMSCKKSNEFEADIRWPDLGAQLFIHLGCLYGLYLALFHARFYTSLFGKNFTIEIKKIHLPFILQTEMLVMVRSTN